MKVVIDHKIPYIKEAVGSIADEVVYLPGDAFTKEAVKDAADSNEAYEIIKNRLKSLER